MANLHPNPTDLKHKIQIGWKQISAGSVTSLVSGYIDVIQAVVSVMINLYATRASHVS